MTAPGGPPVAFDCLLLDLDGVIRHFDPRAAREAESRHGLEPGAVPRAAFTPELLGQVVTGRMTRAEWTRRVGEVLGSHRAAEDWLADRGRVDSAVIEMVRRVRARGLVTAILTNGTDTIEEELVDHGVREHFDHVFNTHFIGVAKPHPGAYRYVTGRLGLEPGRILFLDDKAENVAGARAVGMASHRFVDAPTLAALLVELAVLPR